MYWHLSDAHLTLCLISDICLGSKMEDPVGSPSTLSWPSKRWECYWFLISMWPVWSWSFSHFAQKGIIFDRNFTKIKSWLVFNNSLAVVWLIDLDTGWPDSGQPILSYKLCKTVIFCFQFLNAHFFPFNLFQEIVTGPAQLFWSHSQRWFPARMHICYKGQTK